MKRIFLILTVLAFITQAHAQKQWTLEECIRHAVEHNISIKQIELQKQGAEIDLNTARMSRLPNLSADLNQNWSFGRISTEVQLSGNTSQSNTSFSVGTSVPLFTGFRIPNEIARNKLELEAAVQNLEKAKENLSLNIASLFLQVLFKKELVAVNKQQVDLSNSQVEKTQVLVDAGKVPLSQLYDIEAQVAKDEAALIQAENELSLALLDLTQSLELESQESFDVYVPESDNVISQYMNSIQPVQVVFDNALSVKPVIKEQEYKVASAEKAFKIAQAGYYPSLSLNAGYHNQYYYDYKVNEKLNSITGEPMTNPSLSTQLTDNASQYVGLSLSIPIFSRFSVRNRVRSARLTIFNQELELENTKKTLYKEIQTAYLNATAAQEKYLASDKSVKASEESFKYAEERYEIGKSTVFEFNEAKTRLIQSQSEAIQAKYDYIFRAKILDFYNGVPIRL